MHNLVFGTVFLRKKLFVFQGFCKFAVVFNMKRLFGILLILCSMCSMLLVSCRFGSNESDEDVANDSLSVDTLGLEELDLFEEEVVPKAADEVFDDFLFTYVSNASFRKQRTKGSESLDMDDDDAVVMIYERENDLELQKDTTLQQVILEKINWDINTLRHYQFSKNQGQWFLSSEQDADISDVPNASFLVFLKDFLTDSLYRHESIDLPLLMKYYSEEDDGMVEAELSFEEWNEIFNDLPRLDDYMYNVDYGQSLISSNRKSLLLKGMSNGLFMKFHFGFSEGRWRLIEVE